MEIFCNGMHVHQSILKMAKPFYKQGEYGNLSKIAKNCIGGVLNTQERWAHLQMPAQTLQNA